MVALIGSFDSAPVPTGPGSIGASSSWVIASVPEPASLALLFPAMLVLAVVYFRRCWIHRVYRSREAFVADLETVFRRLPENHRVLVARLHADPPCVRAKRWTAIRVHISTGCCETPEAASRTAGWTHRPRTLACEPLETRTLLSASLPAGWQAVPIGSYDLIAPAGYTGSSVPYGLPDRSCGVEGSCRHLAKDRMERAGRRWRNAGPSNSRLNAFDVNDDGMFSRRSNPDGTGDTYPYK